MANGWRLGDEPSCGIARMFPVACGVNRFQNNSNDYALPGQKKNAASRPGKKIYQHGIVKRKVGAVQER